MENPDPSNQRYFQTTEFPRWEPGKHVTIRVPPPGRGEWILIASVYGLLFGLVGGVILYAAGQLLAIPQFSFLEGFLAAALPMAFVGAMHLMGGDASTATIDIDWARRSIGFAPAAAGSTNVAFQDLEALVLRGEYDIRMDARRFREKVFHARIDAALRGNRRRLLLMTDSREQSCEFAIEQLRPFAEQLAAALEVDVLNDEPIERRHGFLRAITRAPVWMHGLFLLLVLASAGWLASRAMPSLARLQAERRFEDTVAQAGGHAFERTEWKIGADDFGPLKGYSFEDQPLSDDALIALREGLQLAGRFALNLSGTSISDAGLKAVSGNENLVELNLYGTRITDRGLEEIRGCQGLIDLDLSRTDIGDGALAHCSRLPNLRRLRLWGTRVTDTGAELLTEMQGIRELYLNDTLISHQAVARLRAELPMTQIHH